VTGLHRRNGLLVARERELVLIFRDTPAFLAVYSARVPMWLFENESHKPSRIIPSTSF